MIKQRKIIIGVLCVIFLALIIAGIVVNNKRTIEDLDEPTIDMNHGFDFTIISTSPWNEANWLKKKIAADKVTSVNFVEDYNGEANSAWKFDEIQIYNNQGDLYLCIPNGLKILNFAGAFQNFTSLTAITGLNKIDLTECEDLSYLFSNTHIKTFDLRYLNCPNVTNTSHMFESSFYTEVILLNNAIFGHITDASYMFADCGTLGYLNFDNVNFIIHDASYMFKGMGNFMCTTISENSSIKEVHNMSHMFDSVKLSNFDFAKNNVNTEKTTDMSYLFYDSQIDDIDLSSWDMRNVIDTSYMFYRLSLTLDLNVSGWNAPNLRYCDHMFDGCTSLRKLTLDWKNIKKIYSANHMFSGCAKLRELDMTGFNDVKIIECESMFLFNYELPYIKGSGFEVVADNNNMFSSCILLPGYDSSNCGTSMLDNEGIFSAT